MNLKELIYKLFKRSDNAKRNAESADGGQRHVRGGVHRFASARGKAISDCSRVRLLAAAVSSQRGRTPDSGAGDKIRRLTNAAKEAGLWLDKAKQNAVRTETFPTENQVEASLAEIGFVREDRYFFGDGIVSVTDVGAHGDNVLLGDDGKVYFIDPLIRLDRSAEEVIEWLTGFNPATLGNVA